MYDVEPGGEKIVIGNERCGQSGNGFVVGVENIFFGAETHERHTSVSPLEVGRLFLFLPFLRTALCNHSSRSHSSALPGLRTIAMKSPSPRV